MILQSALTLLVLMAGMIGIVVLGLVWQKFTAKPRKTVPHRQRRTRTGGPPGGRQ